MLDSTILTSIATQYHASLKMLRKAIELCSEDLWLDAKYRNPFWHIAYHTLFYANLYVQPGEATFQQWARHREGTRALGDLPAEQLAALAYSKPDILEYHALCSAEIAAKVPQTDLEAQSGFYWLTFNKLELHLYNLRHIQHHTGQLIERLRQVSDIGVPWTGR